MRGAIEAIWGEVTAACGGLLARLAPRRRGLTLYVHPAAGIDRDKRAEPRHPSSLALWLACPDDGHGQMAQFVNISRSGALAVLPGPLQPGQRVVVSLEEGRRGPRVGAVVREVDPAPSCYRVALVFRRPCPEAILDAARGATPFRDRRDTLRGLVMPSSGHRAGGFTAAASEVVGTR
jgi:hypothetical protein